MDVQSTMILFACLTVIICLAYWGAAKGAALIRRREVDDLMRLVGAGRPEVSNSDTLVIEYAGPALAEDDGGVWAASIPEILPPVMPEPAPDHWVQQAAQDFEIATIFNELVAGFEPVGASR